ncbi:hypothetical protein [Pararhodospirillum oryzae]|nr:hypothetical protein [Pararhodospirillum oryzae]
MNAAELVMAALVAVFYLVPRAFFRAACRLGQAARSFIRRPPAGD